MTADDLAANYAWTIDTATHLIADGRPLPLTWERYQERIAARPSDPDSEHFTIALAERQVGYCAGAPRITA